MEEKDLLEVRMSSEAMKRHVGHLTQQAFVFVKKGNRIRLFTSRKVQTFHRVGCRAFALDSSAYKQLFLHPRNASCQNYP